MFKIFDGSVDIGGLIYIIGYVFLLLYGFVLCVVLVSEGVKLVKKKLGIKEKEVQPKPKTKINGQGS